MVGVVVEENGGADAARGGVTGDARIGGEIIDHVKIQSGQDLAGIERGWRDKDIGLQHILKPQLDCGAEATDHHAHADDNADRDHERGDRDRGAAEGANNGARGHAPDDTADPIGNALDQKHQSQRQRRSQQCGPNNNDKQPAKGDDQAPFGNEQECTHHEQHHRGDADPGHGAARAFFEVAALQRTRRGDTGRFIGRNGSGNNRRSHANQCAFDQGDGGDFDLAHRDHKEKVVDGACNELHRAAAQHNA